jgi:hypothetical protein
MWYTRAKAPASPSFVPKLISLGQAHPTVAAGPNPEATTVNHETIAAMEPASNKCIDGNLDILLITMMQQVDRCM